jgi:ABC-type glucose/galactose transport system permease subunit
LALARPLGNRFGRGWQQEVGLVVVIVLLGAYLTSRNSVFLSLENLRNIAEQSTYLGLLAVAMTFDEPAWWGSRSPAPPGDGLR